MGSTFGRFGSFSKFIEAFMANNSQRDIYVNFIRATQAYIAASDALSVVSFPFPIDPEGNEMPHSITWVNELVKASDRLDSAREKWPSALEAYQDCVKSNRTN